MIGRDSINISLSSLLSSWNKFKKGKKRTMELEEFEYNLEKNLFELHSELKMQKYKPGRYRRFTVTDNKKREISVSNMRDKVIHRLLYDYLVLIFDKTFVFDAWSCRKGKGLIGAIERAEKLAEKYKNGCVWRGDIKKFFDNVDQKVLFEILAKKINCRTALWLLEEVICSFNVPSICEAQIERERERETAAFGRGLPIGNLTSQIFANIYLNELDRFIVHYKKPLAYLRYGDDFLVFERDLVKLQKIREDIIEFAHYHLGLEVSSKNDIILKGKQAIKFLGVEIFSSGRRLKKRNVNRARDRINLTNASSYQGLARQHHSKILKELNWRILEKLENE